MNPQPRYRTQFFINNEYVDSMDGEQMDIVNPMNGKKLCSVCCGSTKDVDRAVSSAREAFHSWRNTPVQERGRLLSRLADALENQIDRFASIETLDNGKAFTQAKAVDMTTSINVLRYYAGWADKYDKGKVLGGDGEGIFVYTRQEPLGVCGGIVPFNFPLMLLIWKLAPALVTGNTVVFKTSEITPLSGLTFGELVLEAGFPPGVVNIITGYGFPCGDALSRHSQVAKISFTGSVATARRILKAAAESNLKKVTLELGGKSPFIILDDANLDEAVALAVQGCFFNSGEVCCATSRCFVQDTIYDKFIEKAKAYAENLKIGSGFDPEVFQGPQVSKAQHEKILNYIRIGKEEDKARLITGGEKCEVSGCEGGYFIRPTIFADCQDNMKIAQEEIFGPVISVFKFSTVDEVIKRANDSEFGLASGVMTNNLKNALRISHALQAGMVWVNHNGFVPYYGSFGGYKQSGIGRELGEYALSHYTETKTVIMSTNEYMGALNVERSKL